MDQSWQRVACPIFSHLPSTARIYSAPLKPTTRENQQSCLYVRSRAHIYTRRLSDCPPTERLRWRASKLTSLAVFT